MFKKPRNEHLVLATICEACGERYRDHYGALCPIEFLTEGEMTDLHDINTRNKRMKPFWICYVEGTNGGEHYRHPTLRGAQIEAERLARLTGEVVYLLECVGKCKAGEAPVKWETPTLW